MKKLIEWIVYSSNNKNQISLTVKGILVFVSNILILPLSYYGINLAPDTISIAIDLLVQITNIVLEVLSAMMIAYGLMRKVVTTLRGENAILHK
jgi:hypothetical protein